MFNFNEILPNLTGLAKSMIEAGKDPEEARTEAARIIRAWHDEFDKGTLEIKREINKPAQSAQPKKEWFTKTCNNCGEQFTTSYQNVRTCWNCKGD